MDGPNALPLAASTREISNLGRLQAAVQASGPHRSTLGSAPTERAPPSSGLEDRRDQARLRRGRASQHGGLRRCACRRPGGASHVLLPGRNALLVRHPADRAPSLARGSRRAVEARSPAHEDRVRQEIRALLLRTDHRRDSGRVPARACAAAVRPRMFPTNGKRGSSCSGRNTPYQQGTGQSPAEAAARGHPRVPRQVVPQYLSQQPRVPRAVDQVEACRISDEAVRVCVPGLGVDT